jgi:hypothetical protein
MLPAEESDYDFEIINNQVVIKPKKPKPIWSEDLQKRLLERKDRDNA